MPLPKHAVGVLLLGLIVGHPLSGCHGGPATKPVEVLDERTGVSVASLPAPLEFVQNDSLAPGKRPSFAYLGPLELNRMGEFGYVLWLHLAPGTGGAVVDVTGDAAVSLILDGATVTLRPAVAPAFTRAPYQAVVSWGQTVYFESSVADLKRLARSRRITLRCRAADGAVIEFGPGGDARAALAAFLQARGVTAD